MPTLLNHDAAREPSGPPAGEVGALEAAAWVAVDCVGPVTVAVLHPPDGPAEPLMFDGSPSLASGVFVHPNGSLLTGVDAATASASAPHRYVAVPGRLPAEGPIRVDGDHHDPEALLAALLRRVQQQASHANGEQVAQAVMVVPAGWGPPRRTRLRRAAHHAGLTHVELVDAPTALLTHHGAITARTRPAVAIVVRLLGGWCEATVLARDGAGWQRQSCLDADDLPSLDADVAAERVGQVVASAIEAADRSPGDVDLLLVQAPTTQVGAIVARLRQAGVTAPLRVAGDLDAAYGALRQVVAAPSTRRARGPVARHILAAIAPGLGAPVLLWQLLETGLERAPRQLVPPLPAEQPPYLYTLWPAWSMVAVLVLLAATAVTLALGGVRQAAHDEQARRHLAGGLRLSAAASVAAAFVTAMVGLATYDLVPAWFMLVWTVGPALVLTAIVLLIAWLVLVGHTTALRWRAWLTFPSTAAALATVGLLLIHHYLYTRASIHVSLYRTGLPDEAAQLGAIAVGFAILAVLIPRVTHQVIASPVIVLTMMFGYNYNNLAVVTGILIAAITIWWLIRIRPAAVYSDHNHPITLRAARYERAGTSTRPQSR